jgi:hypothetical protein
LGKRETTSEKELVIDDVARLAIEFFNVWESD